MLLIAVSGHLWRLVTTCYCTTVTSGRGCCLPLYPLLHLNALPETLNASRHLWKETFNSARTSCLDAVVVFLSFQTSGGHLPLLLDHRFMRSCRAYKVRNYSNEAACMCISTIGTVSNFLGSLLGVRGFCLDTHSSQSALSTAISVRKVGSCAIPWSTCSSRSNPFYCFTLQRAAVFCFFFSFPAARLFYMQLAIWFDSKLYGSVSMAM